MEYQKIHAWPNDYILYKNEFEEMHNCPTCGVSWYKVKDDDECSSDESTKKGPPEKVLWYLPIIPRSKHLFANADDAKDLTWHGMQIGEIVIECSTIWMIPLSGRRLIVCIQNLVKRKENLGLDWPVMKRICMTI